MQYRKGISILGYGCMRFTQTGGKIDLEKAEQEVLRAFEMGVNYYDTAYIYPGSEEALGKIIEKHGLRDKITLTTKLPQYMVKNRAGLDKYLDEELKRLRTDHLDYYLMHHMTDYAQWERLAGLGIVEWMKEKKEAEGKKTKKRKKVVLVPRQHGYVPEDPERTRLGALPGAVQLHG